MFSWIKRRWWVMGGRGKREEEEQKKKEEEEGEGGMARPDQSVPDRLKAHLNSLATFLSSRRKEEEMERYESMLGRDR